MFDREKAIQELVNSDFQYIMSGDGAEILDSYLTFGFKGYYEFTDEELICELEQRGGLPNFSDNDGQPDELQEWHDFDPDC